MLATVKRELSRSKRVVIASGYVSGDVLGQFEDDFYRIAEGGGSVKLLVGMAFYEGLTGKNLKRLGTMEERLAAIPNSGIFVCYTRPFHGKIYSFTEQEDTCIYVGSSNFSRSGLSGNLECTAQILDPETKSGIQGYLDYLLNPENAVSVLKADITVHGSKQYQERISLQTLDDLPKYNPQTVDKATLPSFEYSLARIVGSEKSSLNVYFGKGRWSRSTDKVLPRPWYEIELVAPVELTRTPLYPKGDFTAYTDDGYLMPMRTSGDYFKNIRSRGNLQLLGQWIKGKLQKADALIPLTPVTAETLERYGNDKIRFYKMREGEYYMEF